MAIPVYQPRREADLLAWSSQFDTKITTTPTVFGLTAAQATAYNALHAAFASSYALAIDPDTNSKANIAAKNLAKEALTNGPGGARQLVNIIQEFPGTTDAMRAELAIRIRDTDPTPQPIPVEAPVLTVLSQVGRVVQVRLIDAKEGESRGKPAGVAGATVLICAAEEAPLDPAAWSFCVNTTKTLVDIELVPSIAAGAKVWLIAFWRNRKDQAGPASVPVSFRAGDSMSMAS